MKKILFLGASNYFLEAAEYAKSNNIYLIVTDINEFPKAVVKGIADESYSISTIDYDSLLNLCKERDIDGIYAGASEINIPIAIKLCRELKLDYYSNLNQWKMCTNKDVFKEKCLNSGIKVAKVYTYEQVKSLDFHKNNLVTKPVDNNGSRGITICKNYEEFESGYKKALANSKSKTILIEEYIPSDSVIIQYTIQNGIVKFSGISDKKSKKIKKNAAPVMAIQYFPSIHEKEYLEKCNEKAIVMLEKEKIMYGPIWIEAFYHNGEFIFNEIGYRYGGSLTYYPVEFFYGVNQMHLLINQAIGNEDLYKDFDKIEKRNKDKIYSILPLQVKPGVITKIEGIDELLENKVIYRFVKSHSEGDVIDDSGTVSQVFGYMHIVGNSVEDVNKIIDEAIDKIKVYDENNENMLYSIWKDK